MKQKITLNYFTKSSHIGIKMKTPRKRQSCVIKAYNAKRSLNITPKPLTSSTSRTQSLVFRDMKFTPKEVEREILLATCNLPLKKQSNISNYIQTDNLVLQQQRKIIEKYVKTARYTKKKP